MSSARCSVLPLRVALTLGLAALLGACASTGSMPERPGGAGTPATPTAPGTDPGATPRPGTPAPTPLAMEQRFLEDWFRGTPVVIASQPPTTLQVDVPLANSFDAGKADIKPALNAVLDRVAQSMARHAGARITVSAASDSNGPPGLAQARTQRVRDSLGTKGVSATRVTMLESARGGGPTQLRLAMPIVSSQQPVARRNEGERSGVHPVATTPQPRTAVPRWTEKKQP
jgi:outer membrane protein OmpA-like peptidoglycan-associated protein